MANKCMYVENSSQINKWYSLPYFREGGQIDVDSIMALGDKDSL